LFQRKDDEEATVAERLRVYAQQTQPVLSYYSDAGLLRTVRAEGALEEITQRLLDVVGSRSASPTRKKKRAAKRRTPPKAKQARVRKVVRHKTSAKAAKKKAKTKRATTRKVTRKVARPAKRLTRRVRRKSKRR
jgi:adenylate kinase